jgi:small GTP-binding protein
VGKSTLLNRITDAESEVGAYKFTTLTVVPGIMEHKGAKIQILDLPGIISGASKGKGRGREVIAAARSSDLLILMCDVFTQHVDILVRELALSGIKVNEKAADIAITPREKGGITVSSTVTLERITEEEIASILKTFKMVNADVVIRQNIGHDELIDHLSGNRVYLPGIAVLNKIDLARPEQLAEIRKKLTGWNVLEISAEDDVGLDGLRESIYSSLRFMRLYMKPQGGKADMEEPMVVKAGSTVAMVCEILHRDFKRKFRYAQVWGTSGKFPGQTVGLNHILEDGDLLTVVTRKS